MSQAKNPKHEFFLYSWKWALGSMLVALLTLLLLVGCDQYGSPTIDTLEAKHSSGDYASTLEPLRVMLDASPDDPRIHDAYGRALLATGQPSLAIWSLRRATEDPERRVSALLLLSRTLLALHNPSDAELMASRVLADAPSSFEALSLRGRARVAAHREVEALPDLDAAIAERGDDLQLHLARITALVGAGKLDEVEAAIEHAKEIAAGQSVGHGFQPRFCVLGATFAHGQQKAESATERFGDCLDKFPTDVLVVTEFVRYHDGRGEFEASTDALRAAFDLAPEDMFILLNWSRRLEALGKMEEAESLLLGAIEDPSAIQVRSALIDFYTGSERWGDAAQATKALIDLIPDAPPILEFNYADLLAEEGDLERARPLAAELPSPFRELLEGKIELLSGNPRLALDRLDEGIRLWPSNALARDLAGDAAMQIGEIDRAMDSYREGVRNEPGYTRAAVKLARLHLRQGESETAFAVIAPFVEAVPNDAEALEIQYESAARIKRADVAMRALAQIASIPGEKARSFALNVRAIERSQGPEKALDWLSTTGLDLAAPPNRELLAFRVERLIALERLDVALAEAKTAASANPDNADYQIVLARAHWAARELKESRDVFGRALEVDPNHLDALTFSAGLDVEEGDLSGALKKCDQASRAHPDSTEPHWAAIQFLDEDGERSESRTRDLRSRLEALLKIDPAHARAATRLSKLLVAEGDNLERALVMARTGARFGASGTAWEVLGEIHQLRSEPAEAVSAYRRAISRRAEDLSLRARLGIALAADGDADLAREELVRALSSESFDLERNACAALQKLPHDESAEYGRARGRCEKFDKG